MRDLEIGGGRVFRRVSRPGHPPDSNITHLHLPNLTEGYGNAQIDDYGGRRRRDYLHRPGTTLSLSAQFSHPAGTLIGTAGFGFWNAPFGDPTVPYPTLPQAVWFFYGSAPTNLPLNVGDSPGRGWFANTLDATTWQALAWSPFTPFVLLLNHNHALRRRLWPRVQQSLGISYQQLPHDMTAWHDYRLSWQPSGCHFYLDGELVLQTPFSPRGPLGFVCWLDNQYMVATNKGRFGWGVRSPGREQHLHIRNLQITK